MLPSKLNISACNLTLCCWKIRRYHAESHDEDGVVDLSGNSTPIDVNRRFHKLCLPLCRESMTRIGPH